MQIELSILIATTSARSEIIKPLLKTLYSQIEDLPIEVILDEHEKNNVGIKRNNLLSLASGKYVVFIDSDDQISQDYILKILEACKSDSDCIGISGTMTTNRKDLRQWYISKDFGWPWFERDRVYYRTPNHISPVKRELALQAGFPNIPFAEDAEYSRRLLPYLKTETKIEGNIYHYDYITNK